MSRAKRWVFTLNNYTQEDVDRLVGSGDSQLCEYLVFGKERAPRTGMRHLQGFVIFRAAIRLTTVKNRLGSQTMHLEVARGNDKQASEYSKKDGDFVEIGELPTTTQGTRTDLHQFFDWAETCSNVDGRPVSTPEVAREHPVILTKYPRIMNVVRLRFEGDPLQRGSPRPWQNQLESKLDENPDPREVIFVVDAEGGKGKSWFVRYYLTKHKADTQFMSIGKRDDIAHVVKEQTRVFLFDIPRGNMELLQYSTLEQMKNRLVFSPKYNSITKTLMQTPHVVVFCNEDPDYEKMTMDRYNVVDLNP